MSHAMDKPQASPAPSEKDLFSGSEQVQIENVVDRNVDEALRLVGLERRGTYTEEQYRKLRRKLVSGCDSHLASYIV